MFEGISKSAFAVVSLACLGIAGWMMASRNDAVRQLETVQLARDGAIKQVKELTEKVSELEGKVAGGETAKNAAEDAFKKIEEVIAAERAKLGGAVEEIPHSEVAARCARPDRAGGPPRQKLLRLRLPRLRLQQRRSLSPKRPKQEEAKPEEAKPEDKPADAATTNQTPPAAETPAAPSGDAAAPSASDKPAESTAPAGTNRLRMRPLPRRLVLADRPCASVVACAGFYTGRSVGHGGTHDRPCLARNCSADPGAREGLPTSPAPAGTAAPTDSPAALEPSAPKP